MGLNPFRKTDPSKRLDKLSRNQLEDESERVGMRVTMTNSELKKLRGQYDGLLTARRPEETDNDVRMRASRARQLKPQIELLQRDFDALIQQQETLNALLQHRQAGTAAIEGERRIGEIAGMTERELKEALQERQRQDEKARAKTGSFHEVASETPGWSTGELSEEERMINMASEPPARAAEPEVGEETAVPQRAPPAAKTPAAPAKAPASPSQKSDTRRT